MPLNFSIQFFIDNTPAKIDLLKRVLVELHTSYVIEYSWKEEKEPEPGAWRYIDFSCNDLLAIRLLGMYSSAIGLYDDDDGKYSDAVRKRMMKTSKADLKKIEL